MDGGSASNQYAADGFALATDRSPTGNAVSNRQLLANPEKFRKTRENVCACGGDELRDV
jgi:hypothetical protein